MYDTEYELLYTPDGLGRMGEIMPALVAACPRFVAWSDDYELIRGTSPSGDAGLFAHYLEDTWRAGETREIKGALEAIERLLLTGDADIEEVIRNSLLEDLEPATFEAIRRYCGPATLVQWAILGTIGPIPEA